MGTALTGQQVGSSGTYFDDALKIHYLPVIKEQFKKKSVLMENVKKTAKGLDTSGRFIQGAVSKAHTTGLGAKPEGYTLPTPGYEGLETFTVYMKSNYARIQVSGQVIRASRDGRGALVSAFTRETQSATLGLRKDVNRQLFGNGTGVLCLTNGSASSTTLTVDSLFGLAYTSPTSTSDVSNPVAPTKYLKAGMIIDVGDATTYTTIDVDSKTITSRDSTVVCTLTSNSSTWDDNGYVMREDAAAQEMMGLRGIVDDNSTGGLDALQGITRSTTGNDYWNSNIVDTGSVTAPTTLTEELMQQAASEAEENDGELNLIVTTFGLRDSYAKLLTPDKRFVNTLDLKGGFKGLSFASGGDIPMVADTDCPPYFMFFLDTSSLYMGESLPLAWMDDDGSVMSRVTNYDAFEATLRLYANLFTDRPVSNTSLSFVQ
jgi:hypothetical protein